MEHALNIFETRISEMQQNPQRKSTTLWVDGYQSDIQLIRDGEGYLIKDCRRDNPPTIEIRDLQKLQELCETTREAFHAYLARRQ